MKSIAGFTVAESVLRVAQDGSSGHPTQRSQEAEHTISVLIRANANRLESALNIEFQGNEIACCVIALNWGMVVRWAKDTGLGRVLARLLRSGMATRGWRYCIDSRNGFGHARQTSPLCDAGSRVAPAYTGIVNESIIHLRIIQVCYM